MAYPRYDSFKYLYPPRPEFILSYDRISFYERMGWFGQYKKNGTCTILALSPSGDFTAMTRHAEAHKQWEMNASLKKSLRSILPQGEWIVLVSELLHNKTVSIKNTLYIHDILVYNSEYLLGSTLKSRQVILDKILPYHDEEYSHYVLDPNNKLWRAKNFTKDILKQFQSITDPKIDEGIVLKDPTGKLSLCDKPDSNKSWQAKVRYATKNYSF